MNKRNIKLRTEKNVGMPAVLRILLPIIFWIVIWFIASYLINVPLILPTPFDVVLHLIRLIVTSDFWIRTFVTLIRICCGFSAGCIAAIILALLSAESVICNCIISPVVRIVRATPVASFIILVMLWVSYGAVPAVTSALMVCPVIYTNIMTGINETDANLLQVAELFRFSKIKTLKTIYIPSIKPYFSAACINAVGLAWKSGIASEVLCLPKSAIGSSIYHSKLYLETADLFAWTAVVVLLSIAIEKIITHCTKQKQRQ